MPGDDIEVVGVLRQHLEEMFAALDRSAGYFAASDLVEHYRTNPPTPRASRLATQVAKARDHAQGYLEAEE